VQQKTFAPRKWHYPDFRSQSWCVFIFCRFWKFQ